MPAAVEKIVSIIGLLGKLEAGYGQGGSVAGATDGIQLVELPDMPVDDYLWRGELGMAPGTGGQLPDNPPVGGQTAFPYKVRAKGSGAAYSASVLPKDIHVGMRISGHDATIVTTGGSESVTYAPTPGPTGFASGVFEAYARGQKYPLTGVVADFEAEGADEGPAIFTFPIKGLQTQLTDVAVPAITYAHTVIPPNNNGIAFGLGNFVNGRVRRWSFKRNGKILGPRTDRNAAGGHAGFGLSPDRAPELVVVVEQTAFATTPFHQASALHPGTLMDLKTKLAWTLGPIGGVQYNKYKVSGPQGQIAGWKEVTDAEGIACWELRIKITPTTFVANDDYAWLFN